MTNPEAVEALVERLGELLAKATPGPWYHRQAGLIDGQGYPRDWVADAPLGEAHSKIIVQKHSFYGGADDYALITEAVNALPTLLAALSSAPVVGKLDPATIEACAMVAADFYRGHGKTFRTPRAYAYEHAGKAIASAIRRELAASTPKDTGERGAASLPSPRNEGEGPP